MLSRTADHLYWMSRYLERAECLARIRRYRDAGVTHLLCSIGAGALPTEIVRESLECIAADVLPALTAPAGA